MSLRAKPGQRKSEISWVVKLRFPTKRAGLRASAKLKTSVHQGHLLVSKTSCSLVDTGVRNSFFAYAKHAKMRSIFGVLKIRRIFMKTWEKLGCLEILDFQHHMKWFCCAKSKKLAKVPSLAFILLN